MVRAAYDRIYKELRDLIENGRYPYGSLLPSQAELVERYDCAHNTVRKALALLASQGYCQPIHGKGVRVIWRPGDGRTPYATGGFEEHGYGAPEGSTAMVARVITFEEVSCSQYLSDYCGFRVGTPLIHIERVRLVEDRPLIYDDIFLRASEAQGITAREAEHSIHAFVQDEEGLRLVTSKRTITVERKKPEDSERLELDDVEFLAVVTTRTFDGNADLFECAQSRYHPDHFRFHDTALR